MQREVIDNLIQENTSSAMERRSDQFTINLVEPEDDVTQLEANPETQSKQKKGLFSWISSKVKMIIVMVVVCIVVIFIAVYMYKRKQKKDQDELQRIKQKLNERKTDIECGKIEPNTQGKEATRISKEDMNRKANELAKQLEEEVESDAAVTVPITTEEAPCSEVKPKANMGNYS